jgi:hypothetical protein
VHGVNGAGDRLVGQPSGLEAGAYGGWDVKGERVGGVEVEASFARDEVAVGPRADVKNAKGAIHGVREDVWATSASRQAL